MSLRKADLVKMYETQSQGFDNGFLLQILKKTGRGDQYASRDYIVANAILAELIKANAPKSEIKTRKDVNKYIDAATRFRLGIFTPCLAFRYDELKENEQKRLFESKDFVFTEKENGVRGILIHHKGITKLFSRNYSDVDNSVPEYWSNVFQKSNFDDTIAIDVEVKFEAGSMLQEELYNSYQIVTDSKLEAMSALLQMHAHSAIEIQKKFKEEQGYDLITFRLIHPLFYKGVNYLKRPLGEGIDIQDEVIEYCNKGGWNVKKIKSCNGSKEEKEVFLNTILDSGGEGIVAHNRNGFYNTSENRKKDVWVKLKRSVSHSMQRIGLGDTIDGWISGFRLGNKDAANAHLVAALEVSVYIRRTDGSMYEHKIAWVPNIEKTVMEKITETIDGVPKLKREFYNLVVEVDGQAISAKSRRLTHPRLLRWRPEKDKYSCIYTEDFINSQIV